MSDPLPLACPTHAAFTLAPISGGASLVRHVVGFTAEREDAERQLEEAGVVLPFPQRAEWLQAVGRLDTRLEIVDDPRSPLRGAVGVGIARVRALPGHVIYRVRRLGAAQTADFEAPLLQAVTAAARADWRCLRVHIELFERDGDLRHRLGRALRGLGFIKAPWPAEYEHTLSLDLSPGEDALFAMLAPSARRNVRAPLKRGFHVAPIHDVRYAPRLQQLMEEVFRRSGGEMQNLPWPAIIQLSARAPHRSRLAGLFAPGCDVDRLVSFAWGCAHGSYVTYEEGAAARRPELGNLALTYGLLWDLIVWAKRIGMRWFDMGGVSTDMNATVPPQGVSRFKRFFCNDLVTAGEDWILELRPRRARLARALSTAARNSLARAAEVRSLLTLGR